jgi:DNA polymerase-3 subunit chi
MTEVDFYILSSDEQDAELRMACRITQKAWDQGLRVYVLTNTDDEATRMDDLLWTYQQDGFVPHERWQDANHAHLLDRSAERDASESMAGDCSESGGGALLQAASVPIARVLIGTTTRLAATPELLVNLGAPVPEWFNQCPRIVEIVGAAPHCKAEGRARYRTYREQGVPLRTHEV